MPMPSRLRDVADKAGVSVATASRYVNKSGFVSKAAGARIQAAVDELGYLPDLAAGSLVRQRSRLVAVLVPALAQSLFNHTIEALVAALAADGFTAMLGLTGADEHRISAVIDAALGRRVEAIILTGVVVDDGLRARLRRTGVTVIETWGLPEDPIDVAVGFSHRDVGRTIARYLGQRGYSRALLLTTRASRATLRSAGFAEEWARIKGLPIEEIEVDSPSRFSQARAIFRQIRALDERPDVVVCGSDGLAQGIAVEALAAGWRVPDELAVMGFGDLAIAAHMRPSLSTVAIDGERIGHEAADVLSKRSRGLELPDRRIDVGFRLIERESA